jgi:hypothetical protein
MTDSTSNVALMCAVVLYAIRCLRIQRARIRTRHQLGNRHVVHAAASGWAHLKKIDDDSGWWEMTGMTKAAFEHLYHLIEPHIPIRFNQRGGIGGPSRVSTFGRLAMTIYWLHTTGRYREVALIFGVPPSTIDL